MFYSRLHTHTETLLIHSVYLFILNKIQGYVSWCYNAIQYKLLSNTGPFVVYSSSSTDANTRRGFSPCGLQSWTTDKVGEDGHGHTHTKCVHTYAQTLDSTFTDTWSHACVGFWWSLNTHTHPQLLAFRL